MRTVRSITPTEVHGGPGWAVIADGDGTPEDAWTHIFPASCLEWRAAEYGLTDPGEALDVVIHETARGGIPPVDRDDAALRKGLVTSTAPDAVPIEFHNARSTADARAAHLARIAAVKAGPEGVHDPAGRLSAITSDHGMTAAGVDAKRQLVDVARWERLYGPLPLPAAPRRIPVPQYH